MARRGMGPLILAGLAAYGFYKYSKMNEEQKRNLKEKGKKLFDENVPQNLKNVFGRKTSTTANSY
jgi:hypothetical protein